MDCEADYGWAVSFVFEHDTRLIKDFGANQILILFIFNH